MFHYKAANLCLKLSCAVSLRSEDGHRGRGPDNDANSDKVCLHSQQLVKITETKSLTVLPIGAKARIFRRASKNCEKRLLALSCVSPYVRPPARVELGSHRTVFMKFYILTLFENLSRKFKLRAIQE